MSLITDEQVRQFHEIGYFVTEPMWSADDLRHVAMEFHRLIELNIKNVEATGDAVRIENARLRPFIGQAHTRSDLLAQFVKSPIYLEACAKFIGPDADLYYNQIVVKPPEKGKYFGWHQDSGYRQTKPLEYITCWTAIGRTFIDNGCIWVVPGSHKWGLQKHVWDEALREYQVPVDESKAIPVEMKPGQVAIFSSLTLHKSGPNVSSEARLGYVPQYHVPQVVGLEDNKPWGDLHPVLRGGSRV